MADQEVIKHIKAAIDASRNKKKNLRHKVQEILMEVGIIVFAVSLSIWLHGWAEDRKDRREEHEFLVGLKQDLQADLQEMQSDLQSYIVRRDHIAYFQRVGAGEKLNPDSANAYAWVFESWSTISPRTSRFEALKGSGKLGIIENKELLEKITELYTKDFAWIGICNEHNMRLKLSGLMPYLAAHLKYDAQDRGVNWEEVLRQSEMRVLMHQQEEYRDNLNAYKTGIEHCEKIIGEIEREVK